MSELSQQGFVAECERERLQYLQAIQPNGALLGGARGDPRVSLVSGNVADWLGIAVDAVMGQPLTLLLPQFPPPPTEIADIQAPPDAWMHPMTERRLYPNLFTGPRGGMDGLLSCNEENWLLELEPSLPPTLQHEAYRPVPHRLYRMPSSETDWNRYAQYVADEFRSVTGFERVMLYRFRPDGCGEVITESLVEGLPPYLGLRYPASDIPQIARNLYLANRHRQIADRDSDEVPILTQDGSLADLTHSDLRVVSPVHIEYLTNMGVQASLSFSVVLRGQLWGLVACHNRSPRCLALPVRERCADMAQVFAMAVAGYRSHRGLLEVSESDQEIARILELLRESDVSWEEQGQGAAVLGETALGAALMALVNASGAALVDEERIAIFGATPDETGIRAQLDWLESETSEAIFATDGLSQICPAAETWVERASGLLAVRVGDAGGAGGKRAFLWWRPEQSQVVSWAGDPRKSALFDAQRQRLSPRASFERWIETTSGHSEPWTDPDLLRAKKFRSLVLRDINAKILGR